MTVSLVGAVYGTSFAVALSRRGSLRESSADRWLAGLISCAVTAIMTIVLQHRVVEGSAIQMFLERLEFVATLSSGPFLLLYIRSLRPRPDDWRPILHFIPACAIAVIPVSLAPSIEILVAHQVVYTAVAVHQRLRVGALSFRDARMSAAVLMVMGVVHAAQVARIIASSSGSLIDVVPVTVSLAALSFGGILSVASIAGVGERTGRKSAAVPAGVSPATRNASEEEEAIREKIESVLSEEHLYRRTDLGLRDLAESVGITSHELSGVLNSPGGTGFNDLLTRHRLEDAKRRLLDPEHDVYTIEAIGEMSGFGSRSSFHAVFRRELGTTPLRFRASQRSELEAEQHRAFNE